MSSGYEEGMPLKVRDWKIQRYIEHPCPECGAEMKRILGIDGFFECDNGHSPIREVHHGRREH